MTTETHYTYITRSPDGRYYIGVRSCEGDPTEDPYMGSHSDGTYTPSRKRVLATFDSREEAMEHEIYLHELRQVDTNPRYANQARQKTTGFYYSGTGEANPFYGRTHDGEIRKHLKEVRAKQRWFHDPETGKETSAVPGEEPSGWVPGRSWKPSPEHKEAHAAKLRGRPSWSKGACFSEEHRRRISEAARGRKSSDHQRARASETFKGKPKSPEQLRKMSETQRKLKWFYDPKTGDRTKCTPENCPDGYLPGMGKTFQ